MTDEPLVLPADPDLPVPYTVVDAAAKDTRAAGESTLPSAVLDLLAVIRDLADVPLPSLDDADERAWHTLMMRRLGDLHVALDVALDPKWGAFDAADTAKVLRQRLNATPVTYAAYDGGDR